MASSCRRARSSISAFARVRGNVDARAGARVRTDQASIGGNITCEGCVLERLIFTPVGGNVKIDEAPDGTFIFGSSIGGGLEIVESTGSVFLFFVSGSSIEGSLKFELGTGFGLIAGSSTIGGNVQIVKSGEHRLLNNEIGGNVQVVENTGTFPTEIARQRHRRQSPVREERAAASWWIQHRTQEAGPVRRALRRLLWSLTR